MSHLIAVPPTLDDRAFEALVSGAVAAAGERVLLDARHLRWADPYGMIGLLAVGRALADGGGRPALQLPQSAEVTRYLARMGFVDAAEGIFDLHDAPRSSARSGDGSPVLLEITPIQSNDDVHRVVDVLPERASTILSEKLGYGRAAGGQFSIMLSEVCQNITEHADAPGWVGIQSYRRTLKANRPAVVIAVMDLGIGFRGSLAREHSARFGDRWGDPTALEAAFLHGVTRFRDPGRGQGLKNIRKSVGKWGGKIAIRSGTARIADVPEWDDAPPMESGLAAFPGSQILIILPGIA
jgi:hypothetical protein